MLAVVKLTYEHETKVYCIIEGNCSACEFDAPPGCEMPAAEDFCVPVAFSSAAGFAESLPEAVAVEVDVVADCLLCQPSPAASDLPLQSRSSA